MSFTMIFTISVWFLEVFVVRRWRGRGLRRRPGDADKCHSECTCGEFGGNRIVASQRRAPCAEGMPAVTPASAG